MQRPGVAQQLVLPFPTDGQESTKDPGASGNDSRSLTPDHRRLLRLALDLGAASVGGPLSEEELRLLWLAEQEPPSPESELRPLRSAVWAGHDPLGEWFCRLRPGIERRAIGAFYTPPALVNPMVDWVLAQNPARIVDAGCGSGRFASALVRRAPDLAIVAVDNDAMATLLTRATLRVLGAQQVSVLQADYTTLALDRINDRTAFVGNPPYVRHHDLAPAAKAWAIALGKGLGYSVSGLAGLHAHFYLATAMHAVPGDVGCFVTSAEWLDVGYGSIIRDLLLKTLGGLSLHLIDARAVPFEDAMATAVIACFEVGARVSKIRLRLAQEPEELCDLNVGHEVQHEALARAPRWTPLLRALEANHASDAQIPLKAIVRVHRGIVTGANEFFIHTRERAAELGLEQWCRPAIISAHEILRSGGVVYDAPERRLLLDVPPDIDRRAYPKLDAYLKRGEEQRDSKLPLSQRYITSRRRPWWYLGALNPPPMVASYMARQAPGFALNPDGLAIVNIAHGLYPIRDLSNEQLSALVEYLNSVRASFRGSGRTYQGGLEKFEPGELEALPIPAKGPWTQ